MKICSKCGKEYPATIEFFEKRKDSLDGLRGHCRKCTHARRIKYYEEHRDDAIQYSINWIQEHPEKKIEYSKTYYKKHKDEKSEYNRKWWHDNKEKSAEYRQKQLKNNPECCRDKSRRYYQKNREKVNAACREWYKENREKRREYDKQYRNNHREQRSEKYRQWAKANPDKVYENTRRRRARKMGAGGSHTRREVLCKLESQKGLCWWCGKKVGNSYHADHLIPLARGGSDDISNIVIACPKCNLSKKDKLPYEWCGRLL